MFIVAELLTKLQKRYMPYIYNHLKYIYIYYILYIFPPPEYLSWQVRRQDWNPHQHLVIMLKDKAGELQLQSSWESQQFFIEQKKMSEWGKKKNSEIECLDRAVGCRLREFSKNPFFSKLHFFFFKQWSHLGADMIIVIVFISTVTKDVIPVAQLVHYTGTVPKIASQSGSNIVMICGVYWLTSQLTEQLVHDSHALRHSIIWF